MYLRYIFVYSNVKFVYLYGTFLCSISVFYV
jgi:hypothetical protein